MSLKSCASRLLIIYECIMSLRRRHCSAVGILCLSTRVHHVHHACACEHGFRGV